MKKRNQMALMFFTVGMGFSTDVMAASGTAKCREAIGTDSFYIFHSCKPQADGSCHCYSKAKDGTGEPQFVTVIWPEEGEAPAPDEAKAKTEMTAPEEPTLPQQVMRGKRGRFKKGLETDQAEGVEGFEKSSKEGRQKLRENEDWAEGKLPKQSKIHSTSKSSRRTPTDE